ncbi:MAG: ribonuclease P protein component [Actinomycetota bacterium]
MRSRAVRRVLDRARPRRGRRVVLFLAPGYGDWAVVATRRVGGAVERNRAKRILREAWRQVSPQVTGDFDAVLVAREAIRGATTQDLVSEMSELLPREVVRDDRA